MSDDDGWVTKGKPRHQAKTTKTEVPAGKSIENRSGSQTAPSTSESVHVALPGWNADESANTSNIAHESNRKRRKDRFRPRTDEEIAESLFQQLGDLRREIQMHSFYAGLTKALDAAHASLLPGGLGGLGDMVILGLGSPEESRVARYQLALGLLLRDRLAPSVPVRAFDPVFTPADSLLLRRCGIEQLVKDTQGRFGECSATLFYLPHCEAWLCENLLESLLGKETPGLFSSAIIGNSFSCYREQWESFGSRKGRPRPHQLIDLMDRGCVEEVAVPERGFPVISAFNELAIHTFRQAPAPRP